MRIRLVSAILLLSAGSALCQTRDAGPWWPHPTWGRGDQAGGSNWITPDKVLEAVRLVKAGKIYEVGHGIFNIENLALDELARDAAYEFLFVFTPVRFKGATGSPGRPLAIR